MSFEDTIKIKDEKGWEMYEDENGKKRYHALTIPKFNQIARKLKISERMVRRYVEVFCEMGIMKKLRRTGLRGKTIYSVGYWGMYPNEKTGRWEPTKKPFLKGTREMIDSWEHFRVRRSQET